VPAQHRSHVARSGPAGRRPGEFGRDLAVCVALAVLTLALRGPLLRQGLNLADEGYQHYGVQRLAAGQVLYRDFERIYPPGVFYPFVPLVGAFGPSPVATRVVWLTALAALAIASYTIARRLSPWPLALWVGLLPIALPPPIYKTYVPLCWIAGAAVCMTLLRTRSGFARGAAAGAAIGAIACFRHDIALFSLGIAAIVVVRRAVPGSRPASVTGRAWLGLAAGTAAVVAPVLAAFAAHGALEPLLRQLLEVGPRENLEMANPSMLLSEAARTGPIGAALLGFPTVALGVGLLTAGSPRSGALRGPLAVLAVLLAFAHLHWIEWPDMSHLTQLLPLPALITVAAVGRAQPALRSLRLGPRLTAVACAGIAIATLAWGVAHTALPAFRERSAAVSLSGAFSGVRLGPGAAGILAAVVSAVQSRTQPGEPIFVAPYAPMLYVLAERPNPTRYDLLLPGQLDATVEREVVEQLDASGVRVVVVNDNAWGGRDSGRLLRFAPVLTQYLSTHFRVVSRIYDWIIYEREAPAAPNAVQMRPNASSTFAREGELPLYFSPRGDGVETVEAARLAALIRRMV
jgi:hypothetical protein